MCLIFGASIQISLSANAQVCYKSSARLISWLLLAKAFSNFNGFDKKEMMCLKILDFPKTIESGW